MLVQDWSEIKDEYWIRLNKKLSSCENDHYQKKRNNMLNNIVTRHDCKKLQEVSINAKKYFDRNVVHKKWKTRWKHMQHVGTEC